jgi:hypothetical protein
MTGFRATFGPVHVEGLSFDGVDVPVGRAYLTVSDAAPEDGPVTVDPAGTVLAFLNSVDARELDAAMAAAPQLSVGPGTAALRALSDMARGLRD